MTDETRHELEAIKPGLYPAELSRARAGGATDTRIA